jgi:hypothetical protein
MDISQDELDFKGFALDHIEHFDGIPCEFETARGYVYDYEWCWNTALKFGLQELISDWG